MQKTKKRQGVPAALPFWPAGPCRAAGGPLALSANCRLKGGKRAANNSPSVQPRPRVSRLAEIFREARTGGKNFRGKILARPRSNRKAAAGPNAKTWSGTLWTAVSQFLSRQGKHTLPGRGDSRSELGSSARRPPQGRAVTLQIELPPLHLGNAELFGNCSPRFQAWRFRNFLERAARTEVSEFPSLQSKCATSRKRDTIPRKASSKIPGARRFVCRLGHARPACGPPLCDLNFLPYIWKRRTFRELQPAISGLAIPEFPGAGRPNGGFRVSFAVNQARHFPEAGHHSAKGEQQNSGSETPSSPLKAGLFHECSGRAPFRRIKGSTSELAFPFPRISSALRRCGASSAA